MARRQFSREFKLEAVKLVNERGVSIAQASRDLDVHENVLRVWGAPAEEHPMDVWDKVMNLTLRSVFLMSQTIAS